jgi:carbamoyl-phosphate synthase large subunit
LEVNPRASRTVPFVSKAIGQPLAKIAARCMVGQKLTDQGATKEIIPPYYSVKEAVFPFIKFRGVDPILSPEMKSTGEVMGAAKTFGEAFAKAQLGAGETLPRGGTAFLSVRDTDKLHVAAVANALIEQGFELVATGGTKKILDLAGITCGLVNKVAEGRPHIVDMIKNDEIDYIINTVEGKKATADSFEIRREALQHKVSYTTTIAGAKATCSALKELDNWNVNRLQDLHKELN